MYARTFWGDRMLVTPPESLSAQVYLYGFYEEGLTRFMLDQVREGSTVIDVGAHYGYFTLLAARLVGSSGSVHGFEPTPSSYAVLKQNADTKPNVRAMHCAAWSHTTELVLHDHGVTHSMFNSIFTPRTSEVETVSMVKVRALALDEYVEGLSLEPDLIKIDAESAELQVIEGLAATMRRHRPVLTVEVGDLSPDQPMESRELLASVCRDYGYQPFEFSDARIRKHELRERYEYDNILLVAK